MKTILEDKSFLLTFYLFYVKNIQMNMLREASTKWSLNEFAVIICSYKKLFFSMQSTVAGKHDWRSYWEYGEK